MTHDPSREPTGETTTDQPVDPDATTTWSAEANKDSARADLDDTQIETPAGPSIASLAASSSDRRGQYAVVKLHAQGGLGKVSVAVDERIGRRVALKEIRTDRHSAEAERRFLTEAEITGQLEHPGIIPVYQMDDDDAGHPYYVMRFIEGVTLYRAISRYHAAPEPAAFAELINRFQDVCQALAYAHSKNIIHRDLKPANVMLGEYGETLVLDWGLAKRIDLIEPDESPSISESELASGSAGEGSTAPWATMDGAVLGTPSYLAPEQARGEVSELDPRCDVFGLGGILCAIITGAAPFRGESAKEMMRLAQLGDLTSTFERLERSDCDAELKAIAKKCLAPDADDRPKDAGAVAEAVSAHLANVQERLRESELERVAAQTKAAETAKRRRVTIGLGIAVGAFLIAVAVVVANRREQKRQFLADVKSAWSQADERVSEAYDHTSDPPQMRNILQMAIAHQQRAAKRVEDRKQAGDEIVSTQALLDRELSLATRDLELLESFDRYETNSTRVDVKKSRYDNVGAMNALANDLKDYFGSSDENVCAEFFRGRPDVMRERLRDILFLGMSESALIRNVSTMEWFGSVIREVDDDPWRAKVVTAMADSDRDALASLSEVASFQGHSPMFLASFAEWLPNDSLSRRESFLRSLQSKYPAYFWVNHGLARLHVERLPEFHEPLPDDLVSEAQEAIRFFTAATVARPRNAGILVNLGLILEQMKREDEAIEHYRRAIVLRPDYFAGYENLGLALRNRGDLEDAVVAFGKAAQLNPSPYRWAKLGELQLQVGRQEDAIRAYRKGVEIAEPEQAIPHFELASALESLGRLDEAKPIFLRGIEIDPQNFLGQYNLANLHSQMGQFADARQRFETAIELEPDSVEAWVGLAIAELRGGLPAQGIASMEKATEINPESALAWMNLAFAYFSNVDYVRSANAYSKSIALDPQDARSMVLRGEALKRLGRLRDALIEYRRALENRAHVRGYSYPTEQWIEDAERILAIYDQLPMPPEDLDAQAQVNVEHLLLAAWQGFHDQEWTKSSVLIMKVAESQPDLISDHLTGVRAMAAQTLIMSTTVDDLDREMADAVREQAYQWMQADLSAWDGEGRPEQVSRRIETMKEWLETPAFDSVRRKTALEKLSDATRDDWTEFWAKVESRVSESSSKD